MYKKESSPVQSSPKVGLVRGKTSSGVESLAIRFNAATADHSEDILIERDGSDYVRETSPIKDITQGEDRSQQYQKAQQILMFNSSSSAPVSQVTTPDMEKHTSPKLSAYLTKGRHHDEEKSLFSGIKERLHDKFQNNLTAVIGKIEEISGESGLGEALEKRLRKGESFDTTKIDGTRSNIKQQNGLNESSVDTVNGRRSRHNSEENDVFHDLNDSLENKVTTDKRSTSVNVLKDYTDASAEKSPKPRPSSTSSISESPDSSDQGGKSTNKFSLKNWHLRNKDKKSSVIESSQSVPVSMSALLSQKSRQSDIEDELIEEEEIQSTEYKTDKKHHKEAKDKPEFYICKSDRNNKKDKAPDLIESPKEETPAARKLKMLTSLLTRRNVLSAIVALLALFMLPVPSFVSGAVFGALIAALTVLVYQCLNEPPAAKPPFVAPDIRMKPPLRVPEMKESKNIDGIFKGWMNELGFYDQSHYHISNTKSVYVQLEGSNLRLQTPKQGIPKRALWSEPTVYPASFIKQRFFDLTGSKVVLLPSGLVSKRIWSKKYPICISLAKKGKKCQLDGKEQKEESEEIKNMGYDTLTEEELCNAECLYLFARTCREKEEWYRRFITATRGSPLPTRLSDLISKTSSWLNKRNSKGSSNSIDSTIKQHKREGSTDSNVSDISVAKEPAELYTGEYFERTLMEYVQYMTHLCPAEDLHGKKRHFTPPQCASNAASPADDNSVIWGTVPVICDPSLLWVNAALGRLFFDFLREHYWADKVREKIQRKLSKIHVPYFIDELTVTGIHLGTQIPLIQRTSRPYLDDRGLWLDVDIAYGGGFTMSLETKVNLMKLKKTSNSVSEAKEAMPEMKKSWHKNNQGSAVTDSEEEDSAESSTDEEAEDEYLDDKLVQSEPAGKKFLKIVDRIAQSKYFQQATENKYIKKAMEEVSNTRLMLKVEMKSCAGTMVLNIPPPPTDRLWYGFRTNPHLVLSAKPRVGQREVNFGQITDWIEKKLALEFQRVLVMPNMDDLEIPLLVDLDYTVGMDGDVVAEEGQDVLEHHDTEA